MRVGVLGDGNVVANISGRQGTLFNAGRIVVMTVPPPKTLVAQRGTAEREKRAGSGARGRTRVRLKEKENKRGEEIKWSKI